MGSWKKIAGIYLIFNLSSKKCYIGHSRNIKKRWARHKNLLRGNRHKNIHLQSAWNLYGHSMFSFSILEALPNTFTTKEYEAIETKWVLFYKSHMPEFGYNACLPGSIPLERMGEMNECKIGKGRKQSSSIIPCICINKTTKEIVEKQTYKEVAQLTGIPYRKVTQYASYWVNKKGRCKSHKGWIVVRKKEYSPEFNYLLHDNKLKGEHKKTWRDYIRKK
jgi:group I intron endonuclease